MLRPVRSSAGRTERMRSSRAPVRCAPTGYSTALRTSSPPSRPPPAQGGAEWHRRPRHGRPAGVRRGGRHPVRPARRTVLRLLAAPEPRRSPARVGHVRLGHPERGRDAATAVPAVPISGGHLHRYPRGARPHTARVRAFANYWTPARVTGYQARPRQAQRRLRRGPHGRGEQTTGEALEAGQAAAAEPTVLPAVAAPRRGVLAARRARPQAASGPAA